MTEPRTEDELGPGGWHAWREHVARTFREAAEGVADGLHRQNLLTRPDERQPHRTVVDWTGLPLRVTECLGRSRALRLLDWFAEGRRPLQEEYVEWRVLRSDRGIRRVELTTELPDYWRVLAAYEPQRVLELVAEFAGVARVPASAAYGDLDPWSARATEEAREAAFAATMLGGSSPYNDGRTAICCMVQETNTLYALLRLALLATEARVVRDAASDRLRCLTCDEAIPLLDGAARGGRASDPVLVERLGRLAYEGRLIAFEEPPAVSIQSVQHTRLRTPHGEPVPPDWFTFGRGCGSERPTAWQRLTLEVPVGAGFCVGDLVDVATEEPIHFGGQVAELVQVAVVVRVGDRDVVPVGKLEPTELAEAVADALGCEELRAELTAFESSADGR